MAKPPNAPPKNEDYTFLAVPYMDNGSYLGPFTVRTMH